MRRVTRLTLPLLVLLATTILLAACGSTPTKKENLDGLQVESHLIGEFEDDYGSRYTISKALWQQHPGGLYHVEYWNSDDQFVILQNGEMNGANPGLWTRIDWTLLEDVPPYEWGFCLTVYDAETASAAAAVAPARRDSPRNGCNGFPFTRMKRLDEGQDN